MFESKKIVLLGAGYGGILTAKKLAKKFKKDDRITITIIDKNSYHTMLTELHEVAACRVPEDAIRISLEKIFAGRKVNVVMDNISNIDFENKTLFGKNDKYSYDYLVIGSGSKPTYYGCPGAQEHTLSLWSFEDAVVIREHILDKFRKASVESDPKKREQMLTFVVAGCGFTGIEMAGELGEWKPKLCEQFNIDEDDVKIKVVDMLPTVLPLFEDKLIRKTEKRLHKLGIDILTTTSIIAVDAEKVCLSEKDCLFTETVIWAAGVEGSDIMHDMTITKRARNRVTCNEFLQSVDHEDVFAVGDNIFYIPEGEKHPVPQMVENAEHSAKLVASNIYKHMHVKDLDVYKPNFHGAMVCIGGKYGVAQIEMGNKKLKFSGFIAMFIKHFINLIYFMQVAGYNKCMTYLLHEVFHVPHRRSFVGGHFSKASPNFWLVPLRMFLGVKWLLEGLDKLPRVLENPGYIFLIPAKVASGASEVVTEALEVPEFIQSMVEWGMNLLFYTPEGGFTVLAAIFQGAMVAAEIIVGLCLIGGLFTFLASAVSVIMGLMIWSSGMAPPEMLWFMAGGVATIGGSGSTLGLDYYVLPFMKKKWKKFKFAKKWYLYND